jgi:hypothetical protein
VRLDPLCVSPQIVSHAVPCALKHAFGTSIDLTIKARGVDSSPYLIKPITKHPSDRIVDLALLPMPRGPPNAGVLVQVNAPQAKSILQIAEEIEKRNGGQPILEYLSERVTMNLTLFPSSPGRLIRLSYVMKDYEEFVATIKPVWVGHELLNDGVDGALLDKVSPGPFVASLHLTRAS